jgi:hypothetical protein
MELKIYDKANNLRLTASPNSSSSVTEEIGGECSVSASFTHTEYVPLDVDESYTMFCDKDADGNAFGKILDVQFAHIYSYSKDSQ